MNRKLRVGIAGYGVVGKRRYQFVNEHPHMQVIAVCDKTFSAKGQFNNAVRYYQHYTELLEENLYVLFVCLTNDMAALVTIAGLEKKFHVFCEKPPGRDVQDIINVLYCEKKYPHLKLKYGFNHRYHDSVIDALRIIKNKELGAIIDLKGTYGKSKIISFGQGSDWRTHRSIAGGGILLDQGIHMVDLLRIFAGEFSEVYSFISNDFWGHDVEDNAYALMRTADKKVAFLHSSATQWRHRFWLDVTLERGGLVLSGILSGTKSYGAETLKIIWNSNDGVGDPREQTTVYNEDNSWRREIDEFAQAILYDLPIQHGTSKDALKTMQLVYRIYCADTHWQKTWNISDEWLELAITDI